MSVPCEPSFHVPCGSRWRSSRAGSQSASITFDILTLAGGHPDGSCRTTVHHQPVSQSLHDKLWSRMNHIAVMPVAFPRLLAASLLSASRRPGGRLGHLCNVLYRTEPNPSSLQKPEHCSVVVGRIARMCHVCQTSIDAS